MRRINPSNFKRATRTTAREVNRQIALALVAEHQPISRAELARQMKVSRGRITQLVGGLIEDGMIVESETASVLPGRGRRPRRLHIRTRDRLVVAIDVRFSRTYVMLADFAGKQLALEQFATILDPRKCVREIAARVRRLLAHHIFDGECEGIGLLVPGMVDRSAGVVLNAPQLGWRDVAVRDRLAAELGIPVTIENVSLACALAQLWLGGAEENASEFVFVTVGDGVGAAVVVNGQLVRGRTHNAGEFGHVSVDPTGPLCLCGQRGCWEVYTSNLATISRYLGRPFSATSARGTMRKLPLTMEDLIARAHDGDARAIASLEEAGHHLGVGLAGIINALNPARIFIGGEITAAWELIAPGMRKAIEARALTAATAATPVTPDQLGGLARLHGATALVKAPLFAAPVVG